IRRRMQKLERLGAIISIVSDTNENEDNSPVNVSELLQEFQEFVDDDNDLEEDVNPGRSGAMAEEEDDDEEDDSEYRIQIPASVTPETRAKIVQCQNEVTSFKNEVEPLKIERKEIADKLKRTRAFLAEMKKKLKSFRSVRRKSGEGLETKMFRILKSIGVELTRYHGGSLNGKDIKKVMDNACFVFDEFKRILNEGKSERNGHVLDETEINERWEEYKNSFLVWDGAFSFARKNNPEEEDMKMFAEFVSAAVDAHQKIGCNITHKVHLMWRHVEWQMRVVPGGLGDKMEDWVELAHQAAAQRRRRFRTTKNAAKRASASAKVE
ncbi:hypothetical protein ACHAXR_000757, partial [Thalassiosira sp. AJA248-18]